MECVNSSTGQADGYGELKGGYLINVSLAYARMLHFKGGPLLTSLGSLVSFEIVIGLNGKVWINASDVLTTWKIARCVELGQKWRVEDIEENIAKILNS